MPDALGEFGMNPTATLKQSILEQIRSSSVIPLEVVQAMFSRDAKSHEISEVLNDLQKMNQVRFAQPSSGGLNVHAIFQKDNTEDVMLKLLAE